MLAACGSINKEDPEDPAVDVNVNVTFTAEIIDLYEDLGSDTRTAMVRVIDSESKVLVKDQTLTINLNVNPEETFVIGDVVKVGFNGVVMESYPVQIVTDSVEKIKQ